MMGLLDRNYFHLDLFVSLVRYIDSSSCNLYKGDNMKRNGVLSKVKKISLGICLSLTFLSSQVYAEENQWVLEAPLKLRTSDVLILDSNREDEEPIVLGTSKKPKEENRESMIVGETVYLIINLIIVIGIIVYTRRVRNKR